MKRTSVFLVALTSVAFAGAQSAPACVDIPSNLSRGAESANVLKLQNFLYVKGFLRATPNGYFGPGTYAAVRQYQAVNRLSQVGSAGPLTRAAIKKETCKVPPEQAFAQAFAQAAQTYASSSQATTTISPQAAAEAAALRALKRPMVDSVDLVTLFENGETDWTFNMYGSNFQTSGNSILMRNTSTGKSYNLGVFSSSDGKTLTFPKNLTATSFSCGTNCNERLTAGKYEITVLIFGYGQSDPKMIEVKPFTLSATTGAVQGALPASGTNQRFGVLAFSTPESVRVDSITLTTSSSTISTGGVTSTTIKNELTGSMFSAGEVAASYQSLIYGAYVSTSNTKAGDMWSRFSIEIYDYIGKKKTKFYSNQFLVTVAGLI